MVGGFFRGVVTFPACLSHSSEHFPISVALQFCTGQGKGCEAEHRGRRHQQKTVPASFVKITEMQSAASGWEVNLLTQGFQRNLFSMCLYPGFLRAACTFGEGSPFYKIQWYLSLPNISVVLCFTSWLLLGHDLSSCVAPSSD